jgi:ABC-type branched-subunit amino acid transport system substrate-binding protein
VTSADFQASDCSAYNVCTTTVAVTNGKGQKCTFANFEVCVKAVLDGETPHFEGATGPIAFNQFGDPSIVTYVVLQSQGDGAVDDPVVGKLHIGGE